MNKLSYDFVRDTESISCFDFDLSHPKYEMSDSCSFAMCCSKIYRYLLGKQTSVKNSEA